MGQVHYTPEISDDYSSEVIRLARQRSPAIDAWITEEQFLCETVPDNLSPLWLRNRVIIKICEELADEGIALLRDPDEICDRPEDVYVVLMLRKKFDEENLFETLRDHRDLFDEIRGEMDGDTLGNIISWCSRNLPLDEGWEMLNRYNENNPGLLSGEDVKFLNLLHRVIEHVEMLGEPDVTSDHDETAVLRYVQLLEARRQNIEKIANMLWSHLGTSDYERSARERIVASLMNDGFEKHLSSRSCIDRALPLFEQLQVVDQDTFANFLETISAPYVAMWPNHLEYYSGTDKKQCGEGMLAIILATMLVSKPARSTTQPWVRSKLENYLDQLGSEAVEQIKDKFVHMLSNLTTSFSVNYVQQVEGGVNHAS